MFDNGLAAMYKARCEPTDGACSVCTRKQPIVAISLLWRLLTQNSTSLLLGVLCFTVKFVVAFDTFFAHVFGEHMALGAEQIGDHEAV